MSYDPSAGQGMPPGGPQQPGQYGQPGGPQQPGQYGQPPSTPPPGYGAPGPYPTGGSPYGAPGYGPPVGQMPSTYRGWAITSIVLGVFFCLILGMPFGIVANHYAGKVQQSWDMGDMQGAMQASKRARTWNIWATVFIVIGLIVVIIRFSTLSSSSS